MESLFVAALLLFLNYGNSQKVESVYYAGPIKLMPTEFLLRDAVLNEDENMLFVTHDSGYHRVEVGPDGTLTEYPDLPIIGLSTQEIIYDNSGDTPVTTHTEMKTHCLFRSNYS